MTGARESPGGNAKAGPRAPGPSRKVQQNVAHTVSGMSMQSKASEPVLDQQSIVYTTQACAEDLEAKAREKKAWAANKSFEVLKFKFKFPRARTFELFRARSRLYRSQILQVNTR